jgi:hypothetical protein
VRVATVAAPLRRALVLAGASLLALSACGSETSSAGTSAASAPAVVEKEAGAFDKDVQLDMFNDSGVRVPFTLCRASTSPSASRALEESDCPTSDTLSPRGSAMLTSAAASGSAESALRRPM